MKNRLILKILLFCLLANNVALQAQDSLTTGTIKVIELDNLPPPPPSVDLLDYTVALKKGAEKPQLSFQSAGLNGLAKVQVKGWSDDTGELELLFENGVATTDFNVDHKGKLVMISAGKKSAKVNRLYHFAQRKDGTYRVRYIPFWLSIIPPLVAIALALVFREVIVSLFIGIWSGAFIVGGLRVDSLYYFFDSFFGVVERYTVAALADSSHLSIIIFSLLIGGMVAIISRNGGMGGVVKSLSKYARSPRSTQFITWLLGVAIFFDDYANTLIVGNTMRSVTDKFKISREKLAYIVDSTAAPVSAIAFITTWIGAELSYIGDATSSLQGFDTSLTPYSVFISSLKYSFYPVLTLIFLLILIYTGRDYGPMYKAELRARTTGQVSSARNEDEDEPDMEDLSPVKGAPLKWYHAAIPVFAVIFMTLFGLTDTGMDSIYSDLVAQGLAPATSGWGNVWGSIGVLLDSDDPSFFMKMGKLIGASDSYKALLWASFTGVLVAIIITVAARTMKLLDTMHTMVTGFKAMLPALVILTLAWSLAITTKELHTADYLTSILQDSVSPYLMPVIIFILAAFIAFSTGSSWSTMAILYPIAIPTTWAICQTQGVAPDMALELLLNVIAVVLAASVVGDHCSPISDTTILSSLASDCNHIDHVRTQLPYALTVGLVSLLAAGFSTLMGGGWLICFLVLLVCIAILTAVILRFGKVV